MPRKSRKKMSGLTKPKTDQAGDKKLGKQPKVKGQGRAFGMGSKNRR